MCPTKNWFFSAKLSEATRGRGRTRKDRVLRFAAGFRSAMRLRFAFGIRLFVV